MRKIARLNVRKHLNAIATLLTVAASVASAQNAHAAYRDDVLATGGIRNYWRLGETTGSTAADSKGTLPGTISSTGVTRNVTGAIANDTNKAMTFDGTSGAVTVPNASSSIVRASGDTELTLEGWIRVPTSTRSVNQGFFGMLDSTKETELYFGQAANDNRIFGRLRVSWGGNWTLYTPAISANVWYHVALVYRRNLVELYLNKKLVSSEVGAEGAITNNSVTLHIGKAGSLFGKASIDEVALYNVPLNVRDVKKHYEVGANKAARVVDVNKRFFGAWIQGSTGTLQGTNANSRLYHKVDDYANMVGAMPAMINWFDNWGSGFNRNYANMATSRDAIPMLTWMSSRDYPSAQVTLDAINSGFYDDYVRQYARDIVNWGNLLYLRFNHEMNGDWYPWSPIKNGSDPTKYVNAWRRVHGLFAQEGANNFVKWVWCPNVLAGSSTPTTMSSVYPGDAYVDWVALDGYNWGVNVFGNGPELDWRSFHDVYKASYDELNRIAPTKPILLGEVASHEETDCICLDTNGNGTGNVVNNGAKKAVWIRDAFFTQIPYIMPRITGVLWFNERKERYWEVNSASNTLSAIQEVAASSTWNGSGGPSPYPAPTPTPTPSPSFYTSFESGETQPTWNDSVDWSANVSGYYGTGTMESSVRAEGVNRTGSRSLLYAGRDNSTTTSYSYNKVFDVNIPVNSSTQLSYWIHPGAARDRFVAIDLIFTDGSNLRDSGVVDQRGVRVHPTYQGGSSGIALNTWNEVRANLGSLAGKTIDRILVAYDQPGDSGQFRGYMDDIRIGAATTQSATTQTMQAQSLNTRSRRQLRQFKRKR
jgi:beta-mannanase